jgi:methylated-DNA-[protein]-cysteine S-methyltransferase
MQSIWISQIPSTPIGPIWIGVSEQGLAAVTIGGERAPFEQSVRALGFKEVLTDAYLTTQAVCQIAEYLDGERRVFALPVDWSVMRSFQQAVLRQVFAIPYGQVTTYGEIARRLGKPGSARAVGRANATNPMPLVIPCHRVVGGDGKLHGYGAPGGVMTKAWLLRLERQIEA